MRNIELHNTYSNTKKVFVPQNPKKITMYVCGPTVYNYAHIGNARPAVVFDVLFRLLRFNYGTENVVYARNITDIDDKINNEAKKLNCSIEEIAGKYKIIYEEDMQGIGVLPPTFEPLATEHISEIQNIIKNLIKSNHAYLSNNHVMFDIDSFDKYGKLSNRKLEDSIAGARVNVATYKKNPADFILWKPSSDDLPGWKSPWGRGRPGWHIECSAMIEKHLGKTIDIHGGGNDLIFPHHENEIAQSECSHNGKKLANFWLHNGYVTIDKEKMSKSLGNSITLNSLLKSYSGETIRFTLLSAHYRQPLDWSNKAIEQAQKTLDRMHSSITNHLSIPYQKETPPDDNVLKALCDDLNTPKALSELSRLCKILKSQSDTKKISELKSKIISSGRLMGLFQEPFPDPLRPNLDDQKDEKIDALILDRSLARKNKDYKKADEIRATLDELGITLEDNNDETSWRRKN